MGRLLRLNLVAGLGIAVALPALAAGTSQRLGTQTTMRTLIRDVNAQTHVTLTIHVASEDGRPAAGPVEIEDAGHAIAGTVLDAEGNATTTVTLPAGDHALSAVYAGGTGLNPSASQVEPVAATPSATPGFTVAVAPGSLTLTAGQAGQVTVSVIPANAASLTAPMFVTLSCSELPDQSKCTFTPENVEILPNASANVNATLVLATQAASAAQAKNQTGSNGVAMAVLFPGSLALAGLAFGMRRRRWLSRTLLVALVGIVATLGMSACAPLYNYRNHGPTQNLPTPSGNFNVQVDAQSSNGVTATIPQSATLALTVK